MLKEVFLGKLASWFCINFCFTAPKIVFFSFIGYDRYFAGHGKVAFCSGGAGGGTKRTFSHPYFTLTCRFM